MESLAPISLTEITVLPINPRDGLVGWASFVLNNQFYVGGIGLHLSPTRGIRLVYPNKRLACEAFIDFFHPITRAAGDEITNQVIKKYEQLFR